MSLNDGRVITNFINCILNKKELEINGDGNQTRSFCYVDDTIDGLIKMMENNFFGPINLGNPDCEVTLNDLVHIFSKIIGQKLPIKYIALTENDPKMRKPNIEKAIKNINFNPKIDIYEGLIKTIQFFKL
jgi:UDP-glucuronate decarboxylase